MSGWMRIGAEARIRLGTWSVIMDWLCLALVRIRRQLVRFAASSLRRRDALGKNLTVNLGLVDRVWWAGA